LFSILALPHDIAVLGKWIGVGFLVLMLPINLYAGTILSYAADYLERKQRAENVQIRRGNQVIVDIQTLQPPPSSVQMQLQLQVQTHPPSPPGDYEIVSTLQNKSKDAARSDSPLQEELNRGKNDYSTIQREEFIDEANAADDDDEESSEEDPSLTTRSMTPQQLQSLPPQQQQQQQPQHRGHHDTATFDFIGMTSALFHNPLAARWVMILFYTNIFLVLGNYILVMSHAVAAMIGEEHICIPTAGLLAGTLMFAVSQLRTMAHLGRSVSLISLSAMAIVLIQCLYANQVKQHNASQDDDHVALQEEDITVFRKLSALGSIGFAMGSQKLFLNIRHELADRSTAPRSLAASLSAFGTIYIVVILKVLQNGDGKY
jgi:hypothetical protein